MSSSRNRGQAKVGDGERENVNVIRLFVLVTHFDSTHSLFILAHTSLTLLKEGLLAV